jgi:trehalose 6-phosphate phosphatase
VINDLDAAGQRSGVWEPGTLPNILTVGGYAIFPNVFAESTRKSPMAEARLPPIPRLEDLALLLDIDGTILDIAPTPQKVVVPQTLRATLRRLSALTSGALAFVSGRSLDDLDRLFAPLRLPAIAGHGAQVRPVPGREGDVERTPTLELPLKTKFDAIAELGPGIVVEDKDYAIALHYRLAPEKETALREAVAAICAEEPSIEVLPGKYVLEVKKQGFSKATGVRDLMKHPPFTGRRPIFIGDDTTDESVFAIMPEFDGFAFSVGNAARVVDGHFEGPPAVRDWLATIAGSEANAKQ